MQFLYLIHYFMLRTCYLVMVYVVACGLPFRLVTPSSAAPCDADPAGRGRPPTTAPCAAVKTRSIVMAAPPRPAESTRSGTGHYVPSESLGRHAARLGSARRAGQNAHFADDGRRRCRASNPRPAYRPHRAPARGRPLGRIIDIEHDGGRVAALLLIASANRNSAAPSLADPWLAHTDALTPIPQHHRRTVGSRQAPRTAVYGRGPPRPETQRRARRQQHTHWHIHRRSLVHYRRSNSRPRGRGAP